MTFLSLEPFVPSGPFFDKSRELFADLGFKETWNGNGYAGFQHNGCRFILQRYDHKEFAENLMLTVRVDDIQAFYNELQEKGLADKYGIRITKPSPQPYGIEVNLIDLAGVCWHFVQ